MFDLFVSVALNVLHDEVSKMFGFSFVEGFAKKDGIYDFDNFSLDDNVLFCKGGSVDKLMGNVGFVKCDSVSDGSHDARQHDCRLRICYVHFFGSSPGCSSDNGLIMINGMKRMQFLYVAGIKIQINKLLEDRRPSYV